MLVVEDSSWAWPKPGGVKTAWVGRSVPSADPKIPACVLPG